MNIDYQFETRRIGDTYSFLVIHITEKIATSLESVFS